MERDERRRLQVLAGGATDASFTRLPEVYPSARDYSSVWLVAFGYIQMPSDGLILVQRQWAPARGSPINRSCSHARPTRMLGGWPVCHSASVAWSVGCACVAHGTSIGPRSVWPWRGGGDTRHPAPACLLLYRLGALLTRPVSPVVDSRLGQADPLRGLESGLLVVHHTPTALFSSCLHQRSLNSES
jgi:hypothetical protein